jgi:hypothetical protein
VVQGETTAGDSISLQKLFDWLVNLSISCLNCCVYLLHFVGLKSEDERHIHVKNQCTV